ncbi:MAG: hypothetical protein EXS55_04815 [Candidatus Magasanikbacteria bacterium]|nr:hypothetical protein [Candidatus Magasanikbacteria bacterium]
MDEPIAPPREVSSEKDHGAIKELLEKNLKWSQIIYEQNRKINTKLLWMNIGSWFRVFIIIAPVILGVIFFPSLYRKFQDRYGALFSIPTNATKPSSSSVDEMLKVLSLTAEQKEQLRSILK